MTEEKLQQIGEALLKDVPKINGLLLVNQEKNIHKVMKNSSLIQMDQMTESVKYIPDFANEFTALLSDGGVLIIKQITALDYFVIYSNAPVNGIISLFFKGVELKPDFEKEIKKLPKTEKPETPAQKVISTINDIQSFRIIEREGAKYSSEDKSVLRIQKRHLKSLNFDNCFEKYQVYFKPISVVSGDFLWVNKSKDKTILVLADAHITGSSGALLSMNLNGILHKAKIDGKLDFEKFLNKVTSELSSHNLQNVTDESNQLIDLSLALIIINTKNNSISFNSKGIGIIFIQDEKEIFSSDNTLTNQATTMSYNKNDKFFLFSDGLIAHNRDGSKQVLDFFNKHRNSALNNLNLDEVIPQSPIDDITMIGIEF